MPEEESEGPDGILIIHHPKDGSDAYGVGPFPPLPDLVDFILDNGKCDCRTEPLAVVFPPGIRMLVGIDMEAVMEEVERLFAKEQANDRLN